MEYTKPELNLLGEAEGLVLGIPHPDAGDLSGNSKTASAFEFEE